MSTNNDKRLAKIQRAQVEANRFLKAAKAAIMNPEWYCNKDWAQCKRASLDLTRALAELRKSPHA